MILSQGSQMPDFDVLNSQRGGGDDAVHVIKIKKNIGDVVFAKIIQPTELNPVEEEGEENVVVETKKETKAEKYVVPREIVDYLDQLIVKKKLPLRTLKFDIEFSGSKEEVARHLKEHTAKIGNIDAPDLDKLYAMIGYGIQDEIPSIPDVASENNQSIPEIEEKHIDEGAVSVSLLSVPEPVTATESEKTLTLVDLSILRSSYVAELVAYRKKMREASKLFEMMVSNLGGKRDMPRKPEPVELIKAREEYLSARNNLIAGFDAGVDEAIRVVEAETGKVSPKAQRMTHKAIALFDSYESATQISYAILSRDLGMISSIVEPKPFEGMRTEKVVEVTPQVEPSHEVLIKEENQPEALEKKEIPVVQDEKVEKVENIVPIEVELVQEPTNFVPKKEQNVEEKPAEPAKTEIVPENAPVDISIAELPVTPQNIFPTEFEDKKLEVQHGFPGKPNEIKVFYDGKEIATGEVTKDGGKVKIKKDFKSGWLLVDTQEERALKYAMTIIETLKPQDN